MFDRFIQMETIAYFFSSSASMEVASLSTQTPLNRAQIFLTYHQNNYIPYIILTTKWIKT